MSLLFNPVGVFRGKFSSFVYLFVVEFYLFLSFIVLICVVDDYARLICARYLALDKAHQVFNAMPKRDGLSIIDVFNDVRHDDENTHSEFLASLMDYTPTPRVDSNVYKFECRTRLVAVAAQKFLSDIATDALR
ncbi:putative transcription initiation factor TFIID, 23-30kDa subunit [Helianthus annuus]|nr:putative transcription initiation factor TFIID, 23-30kDa subunit [Helianthus annuus]